MYVISGIFREQMLAFAEKNTFPPRLLAVEAREAVRRQAIGKSRWQTAGLSTIRACQKDFFDKLLPYLYRATSARRTAPKNQP